MFFHLQESWTRRKVRKVQVRAWKKRRRSRFTVAIFAESTLHYHADLYDISWIHCWHLALHQATLKEGEEEAVPEEAFPEEGEEAFPEEEEEAQPMWKARKSTHIHSTCQSHLLKLIQHHKNQVLEKDLPAQTGQWSPAIAPERGCDCGLTEVQAFCSKWQHPFGWKQHIKVTLESSFFTSFFLT